MLEDLYRKGICLGTRGVIEAKGGTMSLSARGSGIQRSAKAVTDLHWTTQII
jgi:hypothetical protein